MSKYLVGMLIALRGGRSLPPICISPVLPQVKCLDPVNLVLLPITHFEVEQFEILPKQAKTFHCFLMDSNGLLPRVWGNGI